MSIQIVFTDGFVPGTEIGFHTSCTIDDAGRPTITIEFDNNDSTVVVEDGDGFFLGPIPPPPMLSPN